MLTAKVTIQHCTGAGEGEPFNIVRGGGEGAGEGGTIQHCTGGRGRGEQFNIVRGSGGGGTIQHFTGGGGGRKGLHNKKVAFFAHASVKVP